MAKRTMPAGDARMLSDLSWEADVLLNQRKALTSYRWLLGVAVLVIVILAVAIAFLVPLKKVVPMVVMIDKLTGESSVVATANELVTTSQLTDKHWVKTFLISRERYNYRLVQYDYDMVRRLASDKVWAGYEPLWEGESALQKVNKEDVEITPVILSITLLPSGIATVRYELRARDFRTTTPLVTARRIATIRYAYETRNFASEADAIENPLGFVVRAYQTDPEFTDGKAPS